MIKSYLKIALRNIGRHKIFTFINVVGLSIGISAALVIYLIVQHDLSFDKFHPNGNRIYRVVSQYTYNGQTGYNRGVPGPLPAAIQAQVTGIEKSAPFYTWGFDVTFPGSKASTKFKEQSVIFADARYFDLFHYKWISGSPKTALNQPNSVVLTQSRAKIYFPEALPSALLNKIIIYDDSIKVAVSGIVADFTENTDLNFHDFISYKTAYAAKNIKTQLHQDNWNGVNSSSQYFVQLAPNINAAGVEKQVLNIYTKNHPITPTNKNTTYGFNLQPLADVHLNPAYGVYPDGTVVKRSTLYGLIAIASFLLLLGCINFINLTTAQASQRAKEIGIRKTIGSSRAQLITQLMSETFIITVIAVLISLALTPLILKFFADFISAGIKLNILHQPEIIVFLMILILLVTAASGFYPAIVLSGYKPIDVLKNQNVGATNNTRNAWMRKSLTVTQFVIAQFFIMATLVVSKQIYYSLHKDLGFKQDAIIYIWTPYRNNTNDKVKLFSDKLAALPRIALISRGSNPPSSDNTQSNEGVYKDGKKEIRIEVQQKFGDSNYIKLYGIKLLAGRNITAGDSTSAMLVNETYTRTLGFKNPDEALGKNIENIGGNKPMQITGIIKDFTQESLHEPVKPLVIMYPPTWANNVVHINLKPETQAGHEWKDALGSIEHEWKSVYPNDDFNYKFYDESIRKFYESEEHTSQLLTWASGLSILISCLGLLGLAIYTTTTRTKEIGVRKVLGASVSQIVTLLSTELVALVVLSFIIVTPLAFWAIHVWMQNFADRATISWWVFAVSGAGMLLTALITLSSQTVKAALSNPVKSLRSE